MIAGIDAVAARRSSAAADAHQLVSLGRRAPSDVIAVMAISSAANPSAVPARQGPRSREGRQERPAQHGPCPPRPPRLGGLAGLLCTKRSIPAAVAATTGRAFSITPPPGAMLPSSKGPPNRVERALAKAHLLKLDDPPASDANSGQPQRPRLDRHTFSSTESIQLAARAVRQRQGLPPDSDSDDDRSAPVDATKHTRPEHGDKPVPKNVIHKLRMPDVDKHPHWAKFNDAFQKAPPPLRFVGDTVGFVGNTALTVGMLPIELIVKGIRAGRNVSPETAAAIQKQSIAWDQVDPAFPEGYSTTFLGVDELDLQRAQQVHPVVTDENLPKMYPYPHGITAHEPGLISFKDAFFLIFAGMATAFFLLWYTLAATPSHFFYMLTRLVAMLLVTAVLLCLVALGRRRLLCEIESHRNAIHTARNESLVPSMPESVEWLNASIAALWNQIDPKLFVPLADQVEDVMQASLPKFVNAVKVDDVGIGINPFQLVALRSLRARTPDGREVSHSEDGNENPVPHSASSSGKGQEDASSPQVAERHEGSTAAPSAGRNGEGHASHETSQSGPPQSSQLSGAGPERARPNQAPEPSQHLATDRDIKNPAPKQQDWPQLTEGPINRRNEVDLDLPVQDEHALSQEDLQALTAANLCTKGESIRSKLRHRVLGKISGGEQGKDKDAADDDEQPNKSYQTASGSKRWAETKNQQPAGVSGTPDDPILDESTQEKEINVTDGAGGFVLLEASFSYSAAPKSPRSHNIHMMIQFFLGAMDMFQIPFPVWVQIEKIAGTLRLRAQLVSEPPYVRNLTFTLMGVPRIEVSVVPMVQNMGNILDIPLISNFVQSSIAAAANAYVAPQSMTLNVSEILSGDGVKKDTDTLGILAVHIDYARDLSSQDPNGYSDPYILVMLAKFGRPLYHTRIVRRDLNPVWNEYAFVLVTANDVKNEEQLSIQLWDWDRHSPDDIIGRVTRDVRQLMRRPNRWHRYTDGLRGFDEKTEMQGELTYEVGFFDKAPLGAPIIRSAGKSSKVNDVIQQVGGLDDLADHLRQQEDAELRSRSLMASRVQEISTDSEEVRQEKMALRQRREDRAERNALALQASETMHRPPNPDYPTGVLSVLVESISGLENRDVERGYMGRAREGGAGQDIDNEQASKRIPSSYCEVLLNEEVWYSTRTKQYTNDPFFNAGIELMVRDWRTSNVTIVVRDARLREHDPIMGIVS